MLIPSAMEREREMADEDQNNNNPDDDEKLGEGGLKALKAERDSNKELRARLKKLEDEREAEEQQKLTESQKLEKRAADAEARVKAMEAEKEVRRLRSTVAEEENVPSDLLTGETEEEVKASAKRLTEYLESVNGPRRPQPNPYAGKTSSGNTDTNTEALSVLGFG